MAGFAVRMRVVSVAGRCPDGHAAGQEWIVEGRTPRGVCLSAFGACLPYLLALRYGASFPWEEREGIATVACPDPEIRVVWRLERAGADGG